MSRVAVSVVSRDVCVPPRSGVAVGVFSGVPVGTGVFVGGGGGVIINSRDELNDADLIKNKEQWDQKVVATDLGYFFSDVV